MLHAASLVSIGATSVLGPVSMGARPCCSVMGPRHRSATARVVARGLRPLTTDTALVVQN